MSLASALLTRCSGLSSLGAYAHGTPWFPEKLLLF